MTEMPTHHSHTHYQVAQANRRSQKLSISMPLITLRTDRRRNKNCGGEINAMSQTIQCFFQADRVLPYIGAFSGRLGSRFLGCE